MYMELFTNPILIDPNNGIIAGHARLAAAIKLKMAKVPVIVLSHLTEAQRRALVIADNQLALNIDLLGFDESELTKLLADNASYTGDADEDAVPASRRSRKQDRRLLDPWQPSHRVWRLYRSAGCCPLAGRLQANIDGDRSALRH